MKPLPSPIRRKINRLARRMAEEYEQEQRKIITRRMAGLAATGADHDELAAELREMLRAVLLPGEWRTAQGGAAKKPDGSAG